MTKDQLALSGHEMTRREFCVSSVSLLGTLAIDMSPVASEIVLPTSKIIDSQTNRNYSLDDYKADVLQFGLKRTWEMICDRVIADGEDSDGILKVSNFGELYEIGLALIDKNEKKSNGQYYTPSDVCRIMSEWFDKCNGDIICDVGCGVGNLILDYLDYIGEERALAILKSGRLHLYDIDEIALLICVKSLAIRFGKEVEQAINVHHCDFLDSNISLPEHCKVITNPPYSCIADIPESWPLSEIIHDSKELYAAFMEKILRKSVSSVIITPYSFINGKKFYSLRKLMNNHNGFVVSFDNVPGTIFCGRKHGIFNSNTGNSVRAAITVVQNNASVKGFRFSPLIRFKATERERLLKCNVLESFIGTKYQTVDRLHPMFAKCDKRLDDVFNSWIIASDTVLELCTNNIGKYEMFVPNSCRYFTSASTKPMTRKGQISLRFSDENLFYYVFCMINSSFAYWHWRLYDGGITYPKGLLLSMPLFINRLGKEDYLFFKSVANEMIESAQNYIVTKNNIGIQENIKYPRKYRDSINQRLLKIIGIDKDAKIFDIVHSNMALEVSV